MVFIKFTETVLVHLNGTDVLFLLDINVRDVQPDVAKIGGRLPDLGKDISRLVYTSLVRQHSPDPVRCPNILRVVS